MTVGKMVIREIVHRKASFALGTVSVFFAAGLVVTITQALRGHDRATGRILAARQAGLERKLQDLDDRTRKAMLLLGFNIVILPKDQDLGDWHSERYASKFMPETYVERLADSDLVTVGHLTAALRHKLRWEETQWSVLVVGASSEVAAPLAEASELAPESIPRGRVAVGYEIHRALGFREGQSLRIQGREFIVHACREERGTEEDLTLWMHLRDAQELLGKEGLINEILALQCRAAWNDLPRVRAEIARVLPDTQVIERSSQVLAGVHARETVRREGQAALRAERENRDRVRARLAAAAAVLIPLSLFVCAGWIGLLASGNTRSRRMEIGTLLAMGCPVSRVFRLFVLRSALMGAAGGVLGFAGGAAAGAVFAGEPLLSLASWGLLAASLLAGAGIAVLASWIPAWHTARLDPAGTLNQE